jgi:hypothetical protein
VATDEHQRAVRALDHFLGDATDRGPAPGTAAVRRHADDPVVAAFERSRDRDRGALVLRGFDVDRTRCHPRGLLAEVLTRVERAVELGRYE